MDTTAGTPRPGFGDDRDERDDRRSAGSDDSMLLREERLNVRTVREETGRVRLRKRIVEEERTLTVVVQREEVDILEDDADPRGTGPASGREADRERGVGSAHTRGADDPDAAAQAEYSRAAAMTGFTPDAAGMPLPMEATAGGVDDGAQAGVPGGGYEDRRGDGHRTGRGDGRTGVDGTDDAAEIVLYEQRPVVTLEWVPVERVRLERRTVVEEETFSGEVRREEVDVDIDDATGPGRAPGDDRLPPTA